MVIGASRQLEREPEVRPRNPLKVTKVFARSTTCLNGNGAKKYALPGACGNRHACASVPVQGESPASQGEEERKIGCCREPWPLSARPTDNLFISVAYKITLKCE